jgi:hypothetical protein
MSRKLRSGQRRTKMPRAHPAKSVWRCLGYMALTGILMWLCSFVVWKLVDTIGMPREIAEFLWWKMPIVGLCLGVVLGAFIPFSEVVRNTLTYLGAVMLCGAVMWFFAVLLEGVLIAMGVPSSVAERVSLSGFWAGIGLGLIPVFLPFLYASWHKAKMAQREKT